MKELRLEIKEQLKKLPEKPGVYLMKDKYGNIIYVGKSKNLKNRVRSYFVAISSHPPKVKAMVMNVFEFEYIITDTEMEALILEANLIKKYMPRFNVMLKDDKNYPYIKVTSKEKFPRVFMTRNVIKDGNLYFGPYTSAEAVKETVNVLNKIFPIRKCSRNLDKKNSRPCLNFYINKCMGPCSVDVDVNEYRGYVNEIIKFLSGSNEELLKSLEEKMYGFAETQEFEKAAEVRNQINAIKEIGNKQKIISQKNIDQDIVALSWGEEYSCFMVFYVRGGKLLGRTEKIVENIENFNESQMIGAFVKQYYINSDFLPGEIIIQKDFENKELIEEYLTEKKRMKVEFTIPKKGDKFKLLNMAFVNAEEYLSKFRGKIEKQINEKKILAESFRKIFGEDIFRIESYDISNIYGVYNVASMVVYEDFEKKKNDYRRFKIKTFSGQDDYGSMREVLERRFRHGLSEIESIKENGISGNEKFSFFPDLILVDGGKGQVSSAKKILNSFGIDIPVAGMVKNRKHITDKLYYEGEDFDIRDNGLLYSFLGKLQEEVHRFAIEYHRTLRTSGMMNSVLEEIDGVGKKRRIELIKHFKSIDNIKKASIEDLKEVKGITETVAKNIYVYFN